MHHNRRILLNKEEANMENTEIIPTDIKINKQTHKKRKRLTTDYEGLKLEPQNQEVSEKFRIESQRPDFFPWLTEEIRKLNEEDDRLNLKFKYHRQSEKKF